MGSDGLGNTATKLLYGFLGVVLLLIMGAALLPLVVNATAVMGAVEGNPLAVLFTSGIITIIVVIGIVVAVIKSAGHVSK